MPVSINLPQRRQESDPLDKLETALKIAKAGFGIVADMNAIETAKQKRAAEKKAKDEEAAKVEREAAAEAEDNNPNSPLLSAIREATKAHGITLPEGITPKQARTNFEPFIRPKVEKVKDPLAQEFAQQRLLDAKQRSEDRKTKDIFEKSAQGRLQKLNSGDKARYDNSTLGLKSIQAMDSALMNGDNTFSVIGDNDYTRNLNMAAEAFGRMQSGGAINKDEEARFVNMAPTYKDSKDIQRKKLENMQGLFADRLNTLGFKPEDTGIPLSEIRYAKPQAPKDTGFVEMQAPDGRIKRVPKDQIDAAVAAGGKFVDRANVVGSDDENSKLTSSLPQPPKTVMQNGHTFTLNPKTGQYEYVDGNADLSLDTLLAEKQRRSKTAGGTSFPNQPLANMSSEEIQSAAAAELNRRRSQVRK